MLLKCGYLTSPCFRNIVDFQFYFTPWRVPKAEWFVLVEVGRNVPGGRQTRIKINVAKSIIFFILDIIYGSHCEGYYGDHVK